MTELSKLIKLKNPTIKNAQFEILELLNVVKKILNL